MSGPAQQERGACLLSGLGRCPGYKRRICTDGMRRQQRRVPPGVAAKMGLLGPTGRRPCMQSAGAQQHQHQRARSPQPSGARGEGSVNRTLQLMQMRHECSSDAACGGCRGTPCHTPACLCVGRQPYHTLPSPLLCQPASLPARLRACCAARTPHAPSVGWFVRWPLAASGLSPAGACVATEQQAPASTAHAQSSSSNSSSSRAHEDIPVHTVCAHAWAYTHAHMQTTVPVLLQQQAGVAVWRSCCMPVSWLLAQPGVHRQAHTNTYRQARPPQGPHAHQTGASALC